MDAMSPRSRGVGEPSARPCMRGPAIHGTLSMMPVGADARGRLAVVPALVLVIPLRCSLVAPMQDPGGAELGPPAATPTPEEPAVPAAPATPGPSAATPKQEEPAARIASVAPP